MISQTHIPRGSSLGSWHAPRGCYASAVGASTLHVLIVPSASSMPAMAAFFCWRHPQALIVCSPLEQEVPPSLYAVTLALLPPVSLGAAPSLDVHEAPLALTEIDLVLLQAPCATETRRFNLPGRMCCRAAFVPGSIVQ